MTKNKQDKKDRWERKRVQRVLDYYNKKYGTHIEIKDKSIDVYPQLQGQTNWDWVCYDTEAGEEIAIEVKKLLAPKLEEIGNIMWQLLEEVRDCLSNKLPGTFCLYTDIPKNFYLPIGEIKEIRNRQEFKNTLCKAIYETAQRLKSGENEYLNSQIIEQLPFSLPDCFLCSLHKLSGEGSMLIRGSGFTGFWPPQLDEDELEKFKQLVSHANTQLSQANVKQTFLVIIEEGHRIALPDTVADALKRINRDSYSHINHIYYVSGEKVVEIPLPVIPESAP